MFPALTSMLTWWQWLILAAVPPAIIALYFLKLKRVPLEVPSTYLWRKSIEDLHVNSLWQRLRRNLLLYLQLLLLALIILALLNPNWKGGKLTGDRFIFLVDNSASMSARDGADVNGDRIIPRLDEAKRRIGDMIDAMKTGDAAMLISFSDTAQVVQSYTTNQYVLKRRLDSIQPTNRRTSLAVALRLAAGLANPGQTSSDETDDAAPDARPARMFVLSDFKFPDVAEFSLGNLEPRFEMVGDPAIGNVGIVTFSTRRPEQRPDRIEAFARLENYTPEDVELELELFLDEESIDIRQETIPAGGAKRVRFTIEDVETGVLRLAHNRPDSLPIDDQAWAVVNVPRRSRILFVTPGNIAWERALTRGKASELAQVDFGTAEDLKSKEYKQRALTGYYELIIYDRLRPEEMPQSSTLFIGAMPPDKRWQAGSTIDAPQIIDTERTHPLMQLLELGDVLIFQAKEVVPPSGGTVLIESHEGAICSIAPRQGFEDLVMGFEFETSGDEGGRFYNTNWPLRHSFPVFVQDIMHYLGESGEAFSKVSVHPGQSFVLNNPTAPETIQVKLPDGTKTKVRRGRQNQFSVTRTEQIGVYEIDDSSPSVRRFAVNLFDSLESDIKPSSGNAIKRIGNVEVEVKNKPDWEVTRHEIWKVLALLGLGVLALEWYIYNRRVYV